MAKIPKPPPGKFLILYFASAAAYTQRSCDHLSAPYHLKDLYEFLELMYPGMELAVLRSCAVSVNLEYQNPQDATIVINEGDEVAIIPPVSSG